MSAHTPGPWKVISHPRVAHVDSQRSVGFGANGMASIAWLTGGALSQEANARLIAAAPDLLALVERAFRSLDASIRGARPPENDIRLANDLRDALTKVRGGK